MRVMIDSPADVSPEASEGQLSGETIGRGSCMPALAPTAPPGAGCGIDELKERCRAPCSGKSSETGHFFLPEDARCEPAERGVSRALLMSLDTGRGVANCD